jgi:hypothetical protein
MNGALPRSTFIDALPCVLFIDALARVLFGDASLLQRVSMRDARRARPALPLQNISMGFGFRTDPGSSRAPARSSA